MFVFLGSTFAVMTVRFLEDSRWAGSLQARRNELHSLGERS